MVDVTYQMVLSTLQTAGLLVGIFYYIMVLRNQQKNQEMQLETRQAQLFIQMYGRFSDAAFHDADTDIRSTSWVNFPDFESRVLEDPRKFKSLGTLIRFYEGIGVLVKEGLINMRFVSLLMAGDITQFWEKIGLIIEQW